MSRRWRGILAGALATLAAVGFLYGCNAIVGVEDVRLRAKRDTGTGTGTTGTQDGDTPAKANVVLLALGDKHTCARLLDGTARCWGQSSQGQVGAGAGDGGPVTSPRVVSNVSDAIDIAAGQNHTCVARQSGGVKCWGLNLDGQLGNGESGNVHTAPVDVASVANAIAVAAGGNFSCALRSSGTVVCWGGNLSGQLGNGTLNGTSTPAVVSNLSGAVAIAAGDAHACAVKTDGTVVCWGDGTNGQLGNGSTTTSLTPVAVVLSDAIQVTASERSTCALTTHGTILCWGANEVGQLGTGAANDMPNATPIVVANLDDAVNVAGGQNHTCASRKAGKVACWGSATNGDLGNTLDAGFQAGIVTVTGLTNASLAGAGGLHSCATTSDNGVSCWGANDVGQLGNGMSTDSPTPVQVSGFQ